MEKTQRMADYIYLLENRLSQAQQRALTTVREIARAKGLTVFLVGGAVRDLTSGSPVRDLDVAVQGNALKLKKELQKAGAVHYRRDGGGAGAVCAFSGQRADGGGQHPGGARIPKPGKPVMKAATILDDLRRRDFTANAMALSLNEGSYGLLMDPLNGVADIENRELRLVSNYGFIEEPVRMIRAVRFAARLGWQMEEKTQARYETGKAEGYISAMSAFQRGYEAEEIVHEEDPLRVMRGLEQEGWMKQLAPGWSFGQGECGGAGEAARGADAVADAGHRCGRVGGAVSAADGEDAGQGREGPEEELSAAGVCGGDRCAGGRGEEVCGGAGRRSRRRRRRRRGSC